MHLVRTFKTVELFKVPLCEGISLRMDGMIKRWKKGGVSELNLVIGTYNKGGQSFFSKCFRSQDKFDLLNVAFGIIGKNS